jgi:hypothetical protein
MAEKSRDCKGPTFVDRYGKKKDANNRRYVTEPHIGNPNVDFVLPQPDKARIPGQNFQVISCVGPEGTNVKCKNVAIKLSPCFNTEAEANKHAEKIRNEDPRFDVDVVEIYNWIVIPKSEETKTFIKKEYMDKHLTSVLKGQQQALMQSKKEMDERVARDRANAEAALRKKYGPDYVMKTKNDQIKEYEVKKQEREEQTDGMNFSQRELVDMFAKFIVSTNRSIRPEAAGEFMRFIEVSKIASRAPEGSNVVVVAPDSVPIDVPEKYVETERGVEEKAPQI